MIQNNYTDDFFEVNPINGFLPKKSPLEKLPSVYKELQKLIDEMPIKKPDGSDGYLSIKGAIEKAVENLPNYENEVASENDILIIQALFRAYAFVASAYLLAPAHFNFIETKKYGKAHNILPSQIAIPFVIVSQKLDVYPFIDYHYAYSLGNYVKIDKTKGYEWENLAMAAKFSGMDDERGFIMLHVDINQHSPALVESVMESLISIDSKDDESLNHWLEKNFNSMVKVNERRKEMWVASRWKHYNDFRIFIMGIKGNEEIFGDGLVYQGVSDEPRQYRGQTGAQDNIIPMEDIFTGVINFYPKNQLTKYLMDLRTYRPKCIQHFFNDLRDEIEKIEGKSLFNYLIKSKNSDGLCFLLAIVEEIYKFRNGHWQFVQKYIMANTKYAKATGGTPIISWIPNQIKAVLEFIKIIIENISQIGEIKNDLAKQIFNSSNQTINSKINLLDKQLIIVQDQDYNPGKVFELNQKYNLQDANLEKK